MPGVIRRCEHGKDRYSFGDVSEVNEVHKRHHIVIYQIGVSARSCPPAERLANVTLNVRTPTRIQPGSYVFDVWS